jgi:general secretion pathway protein L
LQQANGAASGQDLETLLAQLESVIPAGYPPTALDFVAGELRLKGPPFSPEALVAMSFKLKPRGYGLTAEGERLLIKPVPAP